MTSLVLQPLSEQVDVDHMRKSRAGVVSWSPPQMNWNPWLGSNIDEGPLATVRFPYPTRFCSTQSKLFLQVFTSLLHLGFSRRNQSRSISNVRNVHARCIFGKGRRCCAENSVHHFNSCLSNHAFFAQALENRAKLPVFESRESLLKVIAENRVTIVRGETGSGKTTQVRFSYS